MPNTVEILKTYDEFLDIQNSSENRLEYIDKLICMSPSPSIPHQRISGNLYGLLWTFFKGKTCDVFSAPTDIELSKDNNKNVVIPDLSVICDKNGFTNNKYIGVPTLIIEILSPSNQSHDLVTKMNLYMRYGVKEYWIINPMKYSIDVYSLDENGGYEQYCVRHKIGDIESKVFKELNIDMEDIFLGV
ncbi:MAG: Uma2 family endonuclease [Clostridium sp.]